VPLFLFDVYVTHAQKKILRNTKMCFPAAAENTMRNSVSDFVSDIEMMKGEELGET